jgi:hypothetical protein
MTSLLPLDSQSVANTLYPRTPLGGLSAYYYHPSRLESPVKYAAMEWAAATCSHGWSIPFLINATKRRTDHDHDAVTIFIIDNDAETTLPTMCL